MKGGFKFNSICNAGGVGHPPIAVLAHNRGDALRKLFDSLREAEGVDFSRVFVYQVRETPRGKFGYRCRPRREQLQKF